MTPNTDAVGYFCAAILAAIFLVAIAAAVTLAVLWLTDRDDTHDVLDETADRARFNRAFEEKS